MEKTFTLIARQNSITKAYGECLKSFTPFVDLYKTFQKHEKTLVPTEFVEKADEALSSYPSSFLTLVNSYMEENLIDSVVQVMQVLMKIPGFHPSKYVI